MGGFTTLMKLFYSKSTRYIERLFTEYATGDQLTMDQFMVLSLERDLFNPKLQATVINSRNPEREYEIRSQ